MLGGVRRINLRRRRRRFRRKSIYVDNYGKVQFPRAITVFCVASPAGGVHAGGDWPNFLKTSTWDAQIAASGFQKYTAGKCE